MRLAAPDLLKGHLDLKLGDLARRVETAAQVFLNRIEQRTPSSARSTSAAETGSGLVQWSADVLVALRLQPQRVYLGGRWQTVEMTVPQSGESRNNSPPRRAPT